MRLIIEVNNDEELKKAQSLIAAVSLSTVDIEVSKRDKIQKLLNWCEQNQFSLDGNVILSREERNTR
ncbi:hypothetical protein [Cyanothece sp. BG0011]|uniref:hypothetical protein n=1 Tax=Cyanothece sp. BG0011 TaxID=2082950 RepID=UPI000D1DB5A9|nr:hypothetical protein [Cyanothece sp. BG0011]